MLVQLLLGSDVSDVNSLAFIFFWLHCRRGNYSAASSFALL